MTVRYTFSKYHMRVAYYRQIYVRVCLAVKYLFLYDKLFYFHQVWGHASMRYPRVY